MVIIMNKKGFTLVELMAVIAILGIILLIAVPSYLGVSKKIKEDMWDNKMKMIETAVEMWVQDNKNACNGNIIKQGIIDNYLTTVKSTGGVFFKGLFFNNYLKYDNEADETFNNPITGEKIKPLESHVCDLMYSNGEPLYFCKDKNNSEGYRGADKLCK